MGVVAVTFVSWPGSLCTLVHPSEVNKRDHAEGQRHAISNVSECVR